MRGKTIIVCCWCILFFPIVLQARESKFNSMGDTLLLKEILHAWEEHNAKNIYLLSQINPGSLKDTLCSGGRSVRHQFIHLVQTRNAWINTFFPGESNRTAFKYTDSLSSGDLRSMLEKSSGMIQEALKHGLTEGKLPNYSNGTMVFFAYLVSHESHHRGQIVLALKQSHHGLKQESGYKLWDWH